MASEMIPLIIRSGPEDLRIEIHKSHPMYEKVKKDFLNYMDKRKLLIYLNHFL